MKRGQRTPKVAGFVCSAFEHRKRSQLTRQRSALQLDRIEGERKRLPMNFTKADE